MKFNLESVLFYLQVQMLLQCSNWEAPRKNALITDPLTNYAYTQVIFYLD
jgi:hypothetical protein